ENRQPLDDLWPSPLRPYSQVQERCTELSNVATATYSEVLRRCGALRYTGSTVGTAIAIWCNGLKRRESRPALTGDFMRPQPIAANQNRRIVAGLPFVESLARRMAASMPNSIDISDLVQDGVLGLIDAAHRFDEERGIKFETFAERRVRGAMIDALRK